LFGTPPPTPPVATIEEVSSGGVTISVVAATVA
jgi:hypothetical protein